MSPFLNKYNYNTNLILYDHDITLKNKYNLNIINNILMKFKENIK